MTLPGDGSEAVARAESPFQKWAHIADISSKLTVGGVVAVVGVYLTYTKNTSDFASQCSQMTRSIFETASSKKYPRDVLGEMAHWIPKGCEVNTAHFVDVLSAVSQGAQSASASPGTSSGTGPSSQNWVAVGYANADMNFTLANGQAIREAPAAGERIRAKSQVSIRPGPADWSNVNAILGTARCFKVDETRTLNAGDLKQIWAKGNPVDCQ